MAPDTCDSCGRLKRTGDPVPSDVLSEDELRAIKARNEARTPGSWPDVVANTRHDAALQEANRNWIGHAPDDMTALLAHIEELEDEIIIRNRLLLNQMHLDSFENLIRLMKENAELRGERPQDIEGTAGYLAQMFGIKRPGDQ